MQWVGIGCFKISCGQYITVMPELGIGTDILQRFVKTAVLAAAMHQRGMVVLHASSVVVNGRAIIFSGESGWGKSTLCAALHARGHHLLTDDVVVCHPHDSGYLIYPGVQEFKLWPDSLQSLGKDHELLPRVSPHNEKRVHIVAERIYAEPAPLACIYVLDWGSAAEIKPIPPLAAAMELVHHTYGIRVFHNIDTKLHFEQTMNIVRSVPIRILQRNNALEDIAQVLELVEQDLAGI